LSERRVVHVFLMCCQGVAGEREAHLAGLRVRGLVKGLGFGEREADLAGLLHELAQAFKETYHGVKRDLLQCQKRPTTVRLTLRVFFMNSPITDFD